MACGQEYGSSRIWLLQYPIAHIGLVPRSSNRRRSHPLLHGSILHKVISCFPFSFLVSPPSFSF